MTDSRLIPLGPSSLMRCAPGCLSPGSSDRPGRFAPGALDQSVSLRGYIAVAATNTIAENYVESIVSYCEGLGLFPHGGIDRADIRPGLRSQAQSTALYCPLPTPTYRYSWSGSGLSLAPAPFSSYDMCMVSEEQIQKWSDVAEARPRRRGVEASGSWPSRSWCRTDAGRGGPTDGRGTRRARRGGSEERHEPVRGHPGCAGPLRSVKVHKSAIKHGVPRRMRSKPLCGRR